MTTACTTWKGGKESGEKEEGEEGRRDRGRKGKERKVEEGSLGHISYENGFGKNWP